MGSKAYLQILPPFRNFVTVVTSQDVHWIVSIMYEAGPLVEQREMFGLALGLTMSDLTDMKRRVDLDHSGTLGYFALVINKWTLLNPMEATIAKLIEILRQNHFNATADKIEKVQHNPPILSSSFDPSTYSSKDLTKIVTKNYEKMLDNIVDANAPAEYLAVLSDLNKTLTLWTRIQDQVDQIILYTKLEKIYEEIKKGTKHISGVSLPAQANEELLTGCFTFHEIQWNHYKGSTNYPSIFEMAGRVIDLAAELNKPDKILEMIGHLNRILKRSKMDSTILARLRAADYQTETRFPVSRAKSSLLIGTGNIIFKISGHPNSQPIKSEMIQCALQMYKLRAEFTDHCIVSFCDAAVRILNCFTSFATVDLAGIQEFVSLFRSWLAKLPSKIHFDEDWYSFSLVPLTLFLYIAKHPSCSSIANNLIEESIAIHKLGVEYLSKNKYKSEEIGKIAGALYFQLALLKKENEIQEFKEYCKTVLPDFNSFTDRAYKEVLNKLTKIRKELGLELELELEGFGIN